ncbi:MAG: LysR family transcriptional regulator [Pseudomonadota bacterium]
MKSTVDWSDLQTFLAVARAGGLSAASAETGLSPATLGRRMNALESTLGQRLFLRGAQGYALAPDGTALLVDAEAMERAASGIGRGGSAAPDVRITAGFWTAQFLAARLASFWTPEAPWRPDLRVANARLDLGRREVDIGVRNRRPSEPWLAGRMLGHVAFAVYGTPGADLPWIDLAAAGVSTPSALWVAGQEGPRLVTNDPAVVLIWLRAGLGRAVLPTFAGDAVAEVARQGPPIAALRTEQWLVSHHDHRHHPPVRAALEALAPVLLAASEG